MYLPLRARVSPLFLAHFTFTFVHLFSSRILYFSSALPIKPKSMLWFHVRNFLYQCSHWSEWANERASQSTSQPANKPQWLCCCCFFLSWTSVYFVMLNWFRYVFLPNTIFILATSSHADEIGVRKYCKSASQSANSPQNSERENEKDIAKYKMVMTKLATIENSWTKKKKPTTNYMKDKTTSTHTKSNSYIGNHPKTSHVLIQRNLIRIEQQLRSSEFLIHSAFLVFINFDIFCISLVSCARYQKRKVKTRHTHTHRM